MKGNDSTDQGKTKHTPTNNLRYPGICHHLRNSITKSGGLSLQLPSSHCSRNIYHLNLSFNNSNNDNHILWESDARTNRGDRKSQIKKMQIDTKASAACYNKTLRTIITKSFSAADSVKTLQFYKKATTFNNTALYIRHNKTGKRHAATSQGANFAEAPTFLIFVQYLTKTQFYFLRKNSPTFHDMIRLNISCRN